MSGTMVSASVVAGAGEGARAYLRMAAGAEEDVVARAAAAACEVARAFLGAELAAEWDDVPGAVAQAIVLLAAHLIEHRDADVAPPAAAVAALLRPFRVVRLLREVAA